MRGGGGGGGGGGAGDPGDFDHTMKGNLTMHQLPESGNFDNRHLESLRGFDIERPGNKYGGEARPSW